MLATNIPILFIQLAASSWVCSMTAAFLNLTFDMMDVQWNIGSVSVSSLGCHSVISLVTIDLDSKKGQPPSWRRDSDNHVIHHSGTEPNIRVRNLTLVVNPHLHIAYSGHTEAHTHTHTHTQAYNRESRQDGLLALKGYSRMFIFVSD